VKVLRGHPLLAKAATTAFELTVSLWFHFDDKPKRRS